MYVIEVFCIYLCLGINFVLILCFFFVFWKCKLFEYIVNKFIYFYVIVVGVFFGIDVFVFVYGYGVWFC